MAIVFDGPTLRIKITSIQDINVQNDLYEAWKQWVKLSDNAKYPPAFDTIGGDPIGGTNEVAPYFFIRNDLGWKIQSPEASGTINIDGNIFGRLTTSFFVAPVGAFTVMYSLLVTSRGTVTTVSSGSGLSPAQDDRLLLIERLLRNKMTTNPSTGVMTFYDDAGTTAILTAQLYEDVAGTQTYRGKGAERRERAV